MPILPMDHPEPFAAVLGKMLYPGLSEDEIIKANSFTALYLAEPIQQCVDAGHAISSEDLLKIAAGKRDVPEDYKKRRMIGETVGALTEVYHILHCTKPAVASWNSVYKIVEKIASKEKKPGTQTSYTGTETSFKSARKQFRSVAHLWAAWRFRKGQFTSDEDVGYSFEADFYSFLEESEVMRRRMEVWESKYAGASTERDDPWRLPDDWPALKRQEGWPKTGGIYAYTAADEWLADLRPAGRPKKPV